MNPNLSIAGSVLALSDSMGRAKLGAAIHEHLDKHPNGTIQIETAEGKTVKIVVTEDQFKKDPVSADEWPVEIDSDNNSADLTFLKISAKSEDWNPPFDYYPRDRMPRVKKSPKIIRDNPERVKTPEDFARIEAAKARRARREKKRGKQK